MARKTYSKEFRWDAVELYRVTEGATISKIAGDLGITVATLSAWIKAAGVSVLGRHGTGAGRCHETRIIEHCRHLTEGVKVTSYGPSEWV